MNDLRPEHPDHLSVPLADAVQGCPGVVDLHGGPFGTVATHLPGRRVVGVRFGVDPGSAERTGANGRRSTHVDVHVVGRYPHPIAEIASQVRAAVRGVVPDASITVTVEDYR